MKTKHLQLRNTLFFLLLIGTSSLFSQTMEWGTRFESKAFDIILGTGLGKDHGIVALKVKYIADYINNFYTKGEVHILGQDAKQDQVVPFMEEFEGRQVYLEKFISHGGKSNILFYVFDAKAKKGYEYLQPLHPSTLMPSGAPRKLGECNNDGEKWGSCFGIVTSPDTSKVMLFKVKGFGNDNAFIASILDADFNLIREVSAKAPNMVLPGALKDNIAAVDNQGNAFFWWEDLIFDPNNKKAPPKQDYMLYMADAKTNQTREFTLKNTGGDIGGFSLDVRSPQYVYGAGLCKGSAYNLQKSVHFLKIDKSNGQIVYEKSTDFSQAVCAQYVSEKEQREIIAKANGGGLQLKDYVIKGLIANPTGGAMVLLEHLEEINDPQRNFKTWDYHNIVVLSYAASGELKWTVKIPKWQSVGMAAKRHASFAYFFKGDKLHILYNFNLDDLDVEFEADSKHMGNIIGKVGGILLMTVDQAGKLERKILTQYTYDDKYYHEVLIMEPDKTMRIATDKLLVVASDQGRLAFGIATLD
jgi:hypothetical protein